MSELEQQPIKPKRKYKKRKSKELRTCPHCHLVLIDKRYDYFKGYNKSTKRLEAIIKKHSLERKTLAKILKVHETTIVGWQEGNGKVREIHEGYFALLKLAGYDI